MRVLDLFFQWKFAGLVLAFCLFTAAPTIQAAPFISSFEPAFGVPGTQVAVTGSGFSGTFSVELGEQIPAEFEILSDSELRIVVPGDGVTAPIRVNAVSGSADAAQPFYVSPRLTSFFPPQGPAGTTVTLRGSNFLPGAGNTWVVFGSVTSQVVNVTAPTQLQSTVPTGATNGVISVYTGAGGATSVVEFISTSLPLITEVSPLNGLPGANINMTINGANLGAASSVLFNGKAAGFTATAETQIVVPNVPADATTGKIKVVTPAGESVSAADFVVGPTITEIKPVAGRPGDPIVIKGNDFSGITAVYFNGVLASSFGLPAPGQISVTVPAGATTGEISLKGTNIEATSEIDFVIGPFVSSFSPAYAPVGSQIRINGAGFVDGQTRVFFGGVEAPNPSSTAPNIVFANVPPGATNAPISVVNSTSTNTSTQAFYVTTGVPFIDSFSPGTGPAGTELTLVGVDFNAITGVTIGGVSAPFATPSTPTQLRVWVPPGALTGPIRVSNAMGSGVSRTDFQAVPKVTGFAPVAGIVGSTVELTGANFTGSSAVYIGGEPVSVESVTSNAVTVLVTANARSGTLKVETTGGSIITTSNFTVRPNILDFDPRIGPEGTSVVLSGNSFFNVTNVLFNGEEAAFTVVSAEQIETSVPVGATTGLIRVGAADGEAFSPAPFEVTARTLLDVSEVVSTNFVMPGEMVSYTATITNRGPANATGVMYTNVFPAATSVDGVQITSGGCTVVNSGVNCNIGVLRTNSMVEITVEARHPVSGLYTNSSVALSSEGDLSGVQNRAYSVVAVATAEERTLNVRLLSQGSAEISWEASPVPFQLQRIQQLGGAELSWSNVLAQPIESGGTKRLTNSVVNPLEVFRLIY